MSSLFYKYLLWKYANRLPFLVIRKYGVRKAYSRAQIDAVVTSWFFLRRHSYIGYAILGGTKDQKNWYRIRQDVADTKFGGKIDFTACDLLASSHFRYDTSQPYVQCLFDCREKKLYRYRKYKISEYDDA